MRGAAFVLVLAVLAGAAEGQVFTPQPFRLDPVTPTPLTLQPVRAADPFPLPPALSEPAPPAIAIPNQIIPNVPNPAVQPGVSSFGRPVDLFPPEDEEEALLLEILDGRARLELFGP